MRGMYDPARPTSGLRPTAGAPKREKFRNLGPTRMPELILTSAQRQALKARAHGLRPVVLLGAAGLSEKVVLEIDRALSAHQLIKIKVPGDDRGARTQLGADVAEKLSAANVQSIGKMIVLFRPQPESEDKQERSALMNQRADERRQQPKNRRENRG